MMVDVPEWDTNKEKSMRMFGEAYTGYCMVISDLIVVGFVTVEERYRGRGYFKTLLAELLQEQFHCVVLKSPSFPTRRLAQRYGYVYDAELNAMVWFKDWPCFNHRCKECEGNMCAIDKHYNDCPYRIDEFIEFVEVD